MSEHQQLPAIGASTRLDRWLVDRGFLGNPFEYSNAEYEQKLPGYFIDAGGFDEFIQTTSPCVIFAGRGCGKTAYRQMLAAQCRPAQKDSSFIGINYAASSFERALIQAGSQLNQVNAAHHIDALLYSAVNILADEARDDKVTQNALEKTGAMLRMQVYLERYAPHKASTRRRKAELPIALDHLAPLELLQDFARLLKQAGLKSGVVLVDGLDEFPSTANNPTETLKLLMPLLGTLPLIECPGWVFKFFLSKELETSLYSCGWFRADRLRIYHITWSATLLQNLVKQRLTYFSRRRPPYESIAQLCEDDLAQSVDQDLVELSTISPRATLTLANMLFQEHARQPGLPERISLATWNEVKKQWEQRGLDFSSNVTLADARENLPGDSPHDVEPEPPTLRIERGFVWLGDQEIRNQINPQDYSVLACLYKYQPNICTKDLIAKEAWGTSEGVSDEAIAVSIRRLRVIFKYIAPGRQYIETFRGKKREEGGYRLWPLGTAKED
ncbi:MAG: winged helix-turn-helix domain-containing protein [Chloroflexota bacterium]